MTSQFDIFMRGRGGIPLSKRTADRRELRLHAGVPVHAGARCVRRFSESIDGFDGDADWPPAFSRC